MPYTVPGSSKTFPLGRKTWSLISLLLAPCWQSLLSQQLASLLSEQRYPEECHRIMKTEYLVPGLSTSWSGASGLAKLFSSVTMWDRSRELSHPKNILCNSGLIKLHTDEEPQTPGKIGGKTPWIIHYSLVYSENIYWISGIYKISTIVDSLSFERFFYFNISPTIPT